MIELYYIIFLILIKVTNEYKDDSKYIILEINKDQILTSVETTETMRQLQYNKIYINSVIGSNNKNIKFYLRFNEYITYITDNYYKKEDSTTYEFTRKGEKENVEYIPNEFHTDDLNSGYESKDIIKLNENIFLNNFNFILVDKLNKEKEFYYPIIGLNIVKENNIRPVLYKTNFLEQLKNNNYISNKIFTIINKEIIFGILPHELDDFGFDENNLNWVNSESGDYNPKWKIKFDNIKFSSKDFTDLITELVIEQNLFTGTWEFKDYIHKNFFEELINNRICKEEKFFNHREQFHYFFYSCESELKSELVKEKYKKNILEFKSNSLNEIFSFNLTELFIKVGTKLYFSIIFDEYQMHGWKLGNIFLQKYPLIFSFDNKAIGYYSQNLKNVKNTSNNKFTYILIGLILFLIIILVIGIRKYNILKKLIPRKLMANELLDQYSYNSHENNNINNDENNQNEITTEMTSRIQSSNNKSSKLGI